MAGRTGDTKKLDLCPRRTVRWTWSGLSLLLVQGAERGPPWSGLRMMWEDSSREDTIRKNKIILVVIAVLLLGVDQYFRLSFKMRNS